MKKQLEQRLIFTRKIDESKLSDLELKNLDALALYSAEKVWRSEETGLTYPNAVYNGDGSTIVIVDDKEVVDGGDVGEYLVCHKLTAYIFTPDLSSQKSLLSLMKSNGYKLMRKRK